MSAEFSLSTKVVVTPTAESVAHVSWRLTCFQTGILFVRIQCRGNSATLKGLKRTEENKSTGPVFPSSSRFVIHFLAY